MLKRIFSNKYLLLLVRIILGLIFIYSGIIKIIEPSGFSDSIFKYKMLPDLLVNFLAIVLPWIELTAGLLLILGISIKENAFIINTLLIIFITAIIINLLRGLDINCGCFGTKNGTRIGLAKITENSFLLVMGILLMLFDSKFIVLHKK